MFCAGGEGEQARSGAQLPDRHRNAVIVDVEATPARTYDEVAATKRAGPSGPGLAGLTGAGLAPDVEDVGKLVERIRLHAGDPGERMIQRQDREQHEPDHHREACGHQDLGRGMSRAEQER